MSQDTAKRRRRVQFSLAAMFVLTTAIAVGLALAMTGWPFWLIWIMYVVAPFLIGLGVGWFSRSRAQLLTAPPVTAAIVPLPWALLAAIKDTTLTGNPVLEFLQWWVMLFPLFLLLGAIPALAGSAAAYWFKGRSIPRDS